MASRQAARKGRVRGRRTTTAATDEIKALLGPLPYQRDLLIEYLHAIQDQYRCIHADHMVALAECMSLSMTEIFEVASFYHHFDIVREGEASPPQITVRVCESVTCALFGSEALAAQLESSLAPDVRIQKVPCVGRCHEAPVAVVGQRTVGAASSAAIQQLCAGATTAELPDYQDYHAYRAGGGYTLLQQCHQGACRAEDVITALSDSGLRGLGGAGYSVGRKWSILRDQPAPRLMAVNIDEGEPGTFKDRHYLERDPHRFIEGMLIAASVVDIDHCYIYLRDEYAACRSVLHKELEALRADPPCKLPRIELRRGAGAYICGEESAMIESIEGKRGMPRLRPPYVAEVGLFGRPTLEHNMESLYWVREILEKGAAWFSAHGRRQRSGLRSFSVSGRVNKAGVHLAPAGISVRELIDEYCGGMLDGHTLYAYFPGGASGGILPASLDHLPLDFDTLQEYGCFIGSAAIIILSEHDSARSAAHNAMKFFEHESCGQCTPCRVGTAKAAMLMGRKHWDQALLGELAVAMQDASICGLGQAAPNPLRCAIKYFPDEFRSDG